VALVGLMLSLWLGLSVLAVSPELHQRLHQDFSSLKHDCLLSLLTKGQLLVSWTGAVTVAAPVLDLDHCSSSNSFACLSADYRISQSRAPPSLLPQP
jgi:hypothetical protein